MKFSEIKLHAQFLFKSKFYYKVQETAIPFRELVTTVPFTERICFNAVECPPKDSIREHSPTGEIDHYSPSNFIYVNPDEEVFAVTT